MERAASQQATLVAGPNGFAILPTSGPLSAASLEAHASTTLGRTCRRATSSSVEPFSGPPSHDKANSAAIRLIRAEAGPSGDHLARINTRAGEAAAGRDPYGGAVSSDSSSGSGSPVPPTRDGALPPASTKPSASPTNGSMGTGNPLANLWDPPSPLSPPKEGALSPRGSLRSTHHAPHAGGSISNSSSCSSMLGTLSPRWLSSSSGAQGAGSPVPSPPLASIHSSASLPKGHQSPRMARAASWDVDPMLSNAMFRRKSEELRHASSLLGEGSNFLNEPASMSAMSVWPAVSRSPAAKPQLPQLDGCLGGVGESRESREAKPRFLQQLEERLDTHLRSNRRWSHASAICAGEAAELSASRPDEPLNDYVLQAYATVFQQFIDGFKAYAPLLSKIKKEYDRYVHRVRELEADVDRLQMAVATTAEQQAAVLEEERDKGRASLEHVAAEHEDALSKLRNLEADFKTQGTSVVMLERANKKLEAKVEEACHQNRVVLSALAHAEEASAAWKKQVMQEKAKVAELQASLSSKLTVLMYENQALQEENARLNSSNIIKSTLVEAAGCAAAHTQKSLEDATVFHITVNGGPERVLDEEELLLASGTHEALRDAFSLLFGELRHLRSTEMLLRQENQRLENELLQSTATGQGDAGDGQSDGRGAAGASVPHERGRRAHEDEAVDTLVAHGVADALPKYLRFTGKVKALWLSEEKCQSLVMDVWADKRRARCKDPLPDFVYRYLCGKVASPADIPAWGHGLLHAGREYTENLEIRFFHDVLLGEVSEDVHKLMLALVDGLRAYLKNVEVEKDGDAARVSGFLRKEDIKAAIHAFFPSKREDEMRAVERLLDEQAKAMAASGAGDLIDYNSLLSGLENVAIGPLEALLRHQFLHDRASFQRCVESHLRAKASTVADGGGDRTLQVEDVRVAVSKADPSMATMRVNQLIVEGFGGALSPSDLKSNARVLLKDFIRRLKHSPLGGPQSAWIQLDD